MQSTSCFENATVFWLFLVDLCSNRFVCVSSRFCFQTCDFTTITDNVQCSTAAVGSCMFVRNLRWTLFEFLWLCFFSSLSRFPQTPALDVWDWFGFTFVGSLLYESVSEQDRDLHLYPKCLLQFATPSGIPQGVFTCSNLQMTCS